MELPDRWGTDLSVWRDDKTVGVINAPHLDGPLKVMVDYDTKDPNPEGAVCNRINTDGCVCRLWRHHDGWDHLPVSPLLLAESGVFVIGVLPV